MTRFFQNDIFSNPGNPIKILYSPVVQDDGTIELVESGKQNFDEYIQSFSDSCDIELLINRFVNGDIDALNQRQGSYGDFTQMPKTYAESLQLVIDAEKHFYEMPLEVRNKFDNNYQKWFVSAGSKDWFEKMGISFDKPVEANEKDVESGVAE